MTGAGCNHLEWSGLAMRIIVETEGGALTIRKGLYKDSMFRGIIRVWLHIVTSDLSDGAQRKERLNCWTEGCGLKGGS